MESYMNLSVGGQLQFGGVLLPRVEEAPAFAA